MSVPFAADVDFSNLHVCIRVSDLERSLAFYRDLVGLPILRWTGEREDPIMVWLPGLQIGTFEGEPQTGGALDHIAISLHNVEAVHQRLLDAGLTPERPYGKTYFPSVTREVQTVFYRDPDGNLVEFLQWL